MVLFERNHGFVRLYSALNLPDRFSIQRFFENIIELLNSNFIDTIMYGTIEFTNNGSNTYNISCIFYSQSNINSAGTSSMKLTDEPANLTYQHIAKRI